MSLITKNHEKVIAFVKTLEELLHRIEEVLKHAKPRLNGESLLTDKEVSQKLKISRRTLQDYRSQGKISYILLKGKILYKESDIQKMLDDNYYKAWQNQ